MPGPGGRSAPRRRLSCGTSSRRAGSPTGALNWRETVPICPPNLQPFEVSEGFIREDHMAYDSGNRWTARATMPQVGIDVGLRQYMLRVYNYMAGGLAITGLVAYFAATSGLYQAIFGTAIYWVVIFAPLAL